MCRRHIAVTTAAFVLASPAVCAAQAPALDAPPALPTDSAAYGASGFRLAVLMQVRADFFQSGDDTGTFLLRKAEVGIRARVASRAHLSIELDPVRPSDPLRRTYLRLAPFDRLHVKLGMEKSPIGLEELLSSATVPFVDRSEVSDRFAAAEEVGVHLESHLDRWILQLSVTNGGRRLVRDDNRAKDVAARIAWAPLPALSIGAAGLVGKAGATSEDRVRLNGEMRLGSGDSGVLAEYFDAKDAEVRSHAFAVGAFHALETGSTRIPQVQPVLRYEHLDRDDDVEDEELRLLTAGLSILFDGHRSKLQANYLWDLREAATRGDVRVQYQVEF